MIFVNGTKGVMLTMLVGREEKIGGEARTRTMTTNES